MTNKGRTPLSPASAQNDASTHRRHCLRCGAFLSLSPTHEPDPGRPYWTWQCGCCGTYQRDGERGMVVS